MAKKAISKPSTASTKPVEFNKPAIRHTLLLLRAIHHPVRQKMLKLIDKKKSILVKELTAKVNLEPAVVSQHLTILKNVGLVSADREGRSFNYYIHYPVLEQINALVEEIKA
jgi:DNA-binding transcriptional ArsR family regulator